MTKAACFYQFWSQFGLNAYEENEVPTGADAPEFPYITYELVTDRWLNTTAMSASLWYRGDSWKPANAKADEIAKYINLGGVALMCDEGGILVRMGSPFAQNMGDNSDEDIKRKVINITAEFLTAH